MIQGHLQTRHKGVATANSFDWSMISHVPLPKTWALAGGLNVSNVENAVNLTKAPILDVSSGLELTAGLKDHNKIKAFMDKIKNG